MTHEPRDTRTYITVHDGLPEHPKVEGLSDKAFRALIEFWCYCSKNMTDGKVSEKAWRKRATPKVRAELLENGNAVPDADGDGIRMHDYLKHQRSRADVEALRLKRASAGALGGKRSAEARAEARWTDSKGEANA